MLKLPRRSLLAAPVLAAPSIIRAQSADAFRIGALNPITGSGSAYGPGMQKIIQATAELVNQAGGAGGRRLEVFAEDDQTQPEAGVLAAKKLVEVNRVQAILGTWASGVTLAVMNAVTQPNDIIHMNVSGADQISTDDKKDLVWRFSPIARSFGVVYAMVARELGFKKPAILQFNNESAAAQAAGFEETWKAQGGTVLDKVVYEARRASYRAELQRALRGGPDVVVLAAYLTDAIIILREWFQTGIPTKFLMPAWAADEKLIAELGPQVTEGIHAVSSVMAEDGRSHALYDEVYRKATGRAGNTNKYGAMCWDMVNVLALAMEAAGPGATTLQINARIREITNPPGTAVHDFAGGKDALKRGKINYDGASSRVDFDANGDDSGAVFEWATIRAGKIERTKMVAIA